MINLRYFQYTSPSSILYLVLYWAGNNILYRVDYIQPGINLQYIPTPPHLRIKWAISTYEKKQYIGNVYNQKIWKV